MGSCCRSAVEAQSAAGLGLAELEPELALANDGCSEGIGVTVAGIGSRSIQRHYHPQDSIDPAHFAAAAKSDSQPATLELLLSAANAVIEPVVQQQQQPSVLAVVAIAAAAAVGVETAVAGIAAECKPEHAAVPSR